MEQQHLTTVEDTNEEALASKISAIRKGYFKDTYAEQFACYRGKRDIIMHRGYWARVYAVRNLVETMISSGQNTQIISLGSGLETLWFNLQQENNLKNKYTFIQLDLPSVVSRKIRKIGHSKKIAKLFQDHGITSNSNQQKSLFTCGQMYKLAACDLSNVQQFKKVMVSLNVDYSRPTFFYAECVLSYIDPDRIDQLLKFISTNFSLAFLFDYQMYEPNDRFGQMMVKNFNMMGCPLAGIYKYPTLKDQNTRFQNCNFKKTECYTMAQVYYQCINKSDRLNIQKIQMLDQLQQWNLIMGHYFALLSTSYTQQGTQSKDFQNIMNNMKLKK